MTLWECVVATAVMTVCLPMVFMAESNAIQAMRESRFMMDEGLVLSSAVDDWFDGLSMPLSTTEEGTTYAITASDATGAGTNSNACSMVRISVQQSQHVQRSADVEIPSCTTGLFTH